MEFSLLQILVTVWIGVHPITYTIPKLYPVTSEKCQQYANKLFAHRKSKRTRMTIECISTDGRHV